MSGFLGLSSSSAADALMGDTMDRSSANLANVDGLIKRDSEVWFEDGNIVVVAQSTAFRFHKSVVSLHSSVFRDLFSIPQPSLTGGEADETFDGCPVVRVSDTTYDFRELIRAIYCGVSYLHPDQVVTFPVLAALARLAHKYQLDQLLAAVIHRLKDTFTTELDVWDRRRGIGESFLPHRSSPEVIEAINLFRLLDRPEMIPAAFYECAQLRPASILRGWIRKDGVTREDLSPADMGLCFEVKEALLQATARLLTRLCEACDARIAQISSNRGCTESPATCVDGLRMVIARSRRDMRECLAGDPFNLYYVLPAHNAPVTGEMCRACGEALTMAYTRERTKIWENLPKLVGVEVANWGSA